MIVESKNWSYQLKDSAADSKLKLLKNGEKFGVEKPGGEKRIHIGSATNASDFDQYFFPEDASDVVFEVSKVDLIQYLLSAHDEFMNPSQSYRMPICDYYDGLLKATLAIEEENFSIRFIKNCDEKRYYIARPSGDPLAKNYFYISNICLPLISKFNFIRNKYDDGGYKFYLKPIFAGQLKNATAPVVRNDYPLQQIFYGAPGTGKSHKVKEVTETLPKSDVFRTTFHPDSDYSTFVGCYKPKMVKAPIRDGSGHEITSACEDEKKRIAYEYEPQAFLKAYVRAYETAEPVFLVIEEINRGNCAQIFGDMFQLLDRNENGESDYAIKPETAIQEFLNEKLKDCDIADEIVKSGDEMRLPANFHIWATMNTSDQSLFPIDSAFKRRWDWKYVPIRNCPDKNWKIKIGEKEYDWWTFLQAINKSIFELTKSEDKKLGFFFCKAQNGIISAETFIGKVFFYLWNDVFKDYDYSPAFFRNENGELIEYSEYYNEGGDTPNIERIQDFIEKVEPKFKEILLNER